MGGKIHIPSGIRPNNIRPVILLIPFLYGDAPPCRFSDCARCPRSGLYVYEVLPRLFAFDCFWLTGNRQFLFNILIYHVIASLHRFVLGNQFFGTFLSFLGVPYDTLLLILCLRQSYTLRIEAHMFLHRLIKRRFGSVGNPRRIRHRNRRFCFSRIFDGLRVDT